MEYGLDLKGGGKKLNKGYTGAVRPVLSNPDAKLICRQRNGKYEED